MNLLSVRMIRCCRRGFCLFLLVAPARGQGDAASVYKTEVRRDATVPMARQTRPWGRSSERVIFASDGSAEANRRADHCQH